MKEHVNKLINSALYEEKNGNFDKAHFFYREALRESGDDPGPVLFEFGAFLYYINRHEEALKIFVQCHQLGYRAEEIEQVVMEAYYHPNVDEFKKKYQENVNALLKYPYFYIKPFADFSETRYRFIPYSDYKFEVFDNSTHQFLGNFDMKIQSYSTSNYKYNDVILIKNEYSGYRALDCESKTRNPIPYVEWERIPLYLYYEDFFEFQSFLQVSDFTKVMASERVVFLFGRNELYQFLSDPQAVLPKHALNISSKDEELVQWTNDIIFEAHANEQKLFNQLNQYYGSFSKKDFLQSIKTGKPKIMFITSLFSTAVQYFTRDCVKACDALGIPNRLFIEKSNIHRFSFYACMQMIDEFKPDIIFIIDHFRWEYPCIHENILFITWVQDPLSHIMSKESASKIKDMDFVMNLYYTSSEFKELGYPEQALIDAPVPVNPELYKTYELTDEEIKKYGTDICVFSNAGNPQLGLESFLKFYIHIPEYAIIEKVAHAAYEEAQQMIQDEKPLYDINQIMDILKASLDRFNLKGDSESLYRMADLFRQEVVRRIYRSIPLEWLADRGYNMKLWGREWLEHPKLKKFAQGVAQNGETLSRIINASKMVIGTNAGITNHPRVFETILSNCFYLAPNIPEPHDWANLRLFMEEGKDIIFFYSKEDLFNKVDYYMKTGDKRREIINNGKKRILSSLTYQTLLKRVLDKIAQNLELKTEKEK